MGSYSYTASVKVVKNMRKEMWSLISIGKFTQFLHEPIKIPPLLESALGGPGLASLDSCQVSLRSVSFARLQNQRQSRTLPHRAPSLAPVKLHFSSG